MKATPKMIQEWARIKLHPHLNTAFSDVGMPFNLATATLGGTEETISAAMEAGNYKKLHRILEAILGKTVLIALKHSEDAAASLILELHLWQRLHSPFAFSFFLTSHDFLHSSSNMTQVSQYQELHLLSILVALGDCKGDRLGDSINITILCRYVSAISFLLLREHHSCCAS